MLAVRVASSLTSSDLAHDRAVSRGLRRLAAADSSPSPSGLPVVSPRPVSPKRPIQTDPSHTAHFLGAGRPRVSSTCGQGRGRGDLVLDRVARGLRQPRGAAVTPPNKRLKLAGGARFKGSGVLCPSPHELSFNDGCAGGRVARSLRAIR